MTAKYFAILTNQGAARLANAAALGTRLNLTQMAVGDANGTLPTPDPAQTKLINQKRIAPLNLLTVDPANTSQIIAEQIIPENEGGFWIREIGLYDDDGILIAVANCPETYKPQLQEGSGRTQTIRMILIVSSTSAITLKIDPSVVLATRKYVDDAVIEVKSYVDNKLKEHEQSRNHPDASTTEKGFVRLSSEVTSTSEGMGATPKAVKIAMDNANARLAKDRNGADIPNPDLFIQNLGLGSIAKENTVPVSKGGTGAGTLAQARANLGVDKLASGGVQTTLSAPTGKIYIYVNDNGTWGAYSTDNGQVTLPVTSGGTGAKSAADARANLGLGSASTKNAQSGVTDRTDGALMLVGAFGLGGVASDVADTDVTNIFTLPIGDPGNPEPYQNYVHINLSGTRFYSSRIALSMNGTDNPRIFIKNRSGATESEWIEVFTSRNPPKSVATLSTARKISVSGDASGYAMFNGGADADISVTVADSAKGVIRLREGSVSTIGTSTPNFISIDTGLLVRGITFTAGAQTVNTRPLQMLIGTQWVTVGLS
ncbi:TPA: phage tail protein [Escherichia coli]|nr:MULTISPECIES: phage tail protein [Escherichia]MCO7966185.1 phage tail protein [Escherichia fergusonii]